MPSPLRHALSIALCASLSPAILDHVVHGQSPAPSPSFQQPITGMTRSLRSGMKDMLEATRNKEFLATPLTAERLEALRTHLGQDIARRALGAGELEGKTIKDLVSSRPELAKEFPQVISYLAATQRTQGVRVYGNDRDPQPLETSAPARLISNEDLKRAAGRGETPEALREYMRSNFALDDAQLRAYAAFLDLAAGKPPRALSASAAKRGTEPPVDSLVTAVKGVPERGPAASGGLYLPGNEVLSRISQLMAFQDAFRDESGADPSRFRGPDGRTLADLMAEFDPDSGRHRSVDDLRRMTAGQVEEAISGLMGNIVKAELEGPNRFLFELGLAWVKAAGDLAEATSSARRSGRSVGPTLGNGKVRENHDELYRKLILESPKGPERDRIELESDGEFFAIRGRPADIANKHYDPPIDAEGSVFGAGMNLDNVPKSKP